MSLSALNYEIGERITLDDPEMDLRKVYPNLDKLVCPITGSRVVFVSHYIRETDARKVRAHFRSRDPHATGGIIFDPEIGELRGSGWRVGGERYEHLEGKAHVREWLINEHKVVPQAVETERVVELPDGRKRIADVAITFPDGRMEAHEVQLANTSLENLEQRIDDYASVGIHSVWHIGLECGRNQDVRNYLRRHQGFVSLLEYGESAMEKR